MSDSALTSGVATLSISASKLDERDIGACIQSAMRTFLEAFSCYDVMPTSGKVVVFDVEVPVKLAFYAFVEHELIHAPLWDSFVGDFTGILSAGDFMDIIRHYHAAGQAQNGLPSYTVRAWREQIAHHPGVSCELDGSLPILDGDKRSTPAFARTPPASASPCSPSDRPSISPTSRSDTRSISPTDMSTSKSSVQLTPAEGTTSPVPTPAAAAPATTSARLKPSNSPSDSMEASTLAFRRSRNLDPLQIGHPSIHHRYLVSIKPGASLWTALRMMRDYRVRRLPVIDKDSNTVLCMLTRYTIFRFFCMMFEDPVSFDVPLQRAGIGSWGALVTAQGSQTTAEVLKLLAQHNLSAIPIVDDRGAILDVYSRSDITFLARDPELGTLDTSVINVRQTQFKVCGINSNLQTCQATDSLEHVIHQLSDSGAAQVYVVNDDRKPIAAIALSDVFHWLLRGEPPLVDPSEVAGMFGGRAHEDPEPLDIAPSPTASNPEAPTPPS